MKTRWGRLALASIMVVGAAVLASGGSAATNRDVDFTLHTLPGPASVTYGENVAYRAEISNASGSTLTHVIFRMRKPYVGPVDSPVAQASFVDSTCPQNDGQGIWVTYTDGSSEWTCDFGSLPAWTADTPQRVLTVVWQAPTLTGADDCAGCLQAVARVTVKEGVNDQPDLNDTFSQQSESATLLSADSDTLDSNDTTMAGGYEIVPCTDAFGQGSLQTKRKLGSNNSLSTTLCIPTIPTDANDLGLATTILEEALHPGDPGIAALGRSNVCVAALGENCGGDYVAQQFGTDQPLTLVFRAADAALLPGQKITVVYHNGFPLPTCATNPTNAIGCTQSIVRSGSKVKIWTIVVTSPVNGWFTQG